jgi:uncharacterized UBP type Zn finger protein
MAQLEGMDFSTVRCQKALLATGNTDAESAMEWLFAHLVDPGELTQASFVNTTLSFIVSLDIDESY